MNIKPEDIRKMQEFGNVCVPMGDDAREIELFNDEEVGRVFHKITHIILGNDDDIELTEREQQLFDMYFPKVIEMTLSTIDVQKSRR